MKKILIILLTMTAGLVCWYYRDTLFGTSAGGVKKRVEDADDAIKQQVYTFSIDGKTPKGAKQWHLEGKSAEMVGDDIHLKDLVAVAYGEEYTINLVSDKGIYNKAKGEVELIGDVVVTSDDGGVLKTDRAKWNQVSKEVYTDSIVNIERDGISAVGTGGRANSKEKSAVLLSEVTVNLEPDTLVECDGSLEAGFDDNKAVFSDNVRVTDKDGRMFADTLTVHFDPDSHKISQVIAEGNVKVLKGKSYTLAEKATYTDGTRSVKFVGKPRVVIAPEELDNSGFFSGDILGDKSYGEKSDNGKD